MTKSDFVKEIFKSRGQNIIIGNNYSLKKSLVYIYIYIYIYIGIRLVGFYTSGVL